MENIKEFLSKLSELSRKYKIQISGCGCCGGPHLLPIKDDFLEGKYKIRDDENLSWDQQEDD